MFIHIFFGIFDKEILVTGVSSVGGDEETLTSIYSLLKEMTLYENL